MSGLIFSETSPLNSKSSYSELETVEFVLDFPDKKLVLGSIRIEGSLLCESSPGNINTIEKVAFDGAVGIHNIIDSVNTELQNQGNIEVIQSDYGRYVKVLHVSSKDENSLLQASMVSELRVPNDRISRSLTRGINTGQPVPFSFKPEICLNNNVGGDGGLSYSKSGFVKIAINLNRASNMFYGTGNTSNQTYTLSNLKCKYICMVDDGSNSQNTLKTTYTLKNSINSDNANVSSKVPAVCNGVSMSFQTQSNENSVITNNLLLERPNSLSQVQYLFNDTNKYITYTLRTEEEYLDNALQSVKLSNVSGVSQSKLKANDSFLLGTRFNGLVDLSVNNFNLQLTADIGGVPMVVYQVFHSSVVV